MIRRETARLKKMLDNLLGPRDLLHKKNHDIHKTLSHVLNLVAPVMGNVKLEQYFDITLPEFCYDEDKLIQALLNLIKNALEAMEGVGRLKIRTRVETQFTLGGTIYPLVAAIEIEDSGPGIPSELLDSIFMPMFTTKATGSGVGLAVTQSIFRRHEGLVVVSSKPGKTVFTGYLPLLNEECSDE